MYISVKSDYALLAIFDLAAQRPGEPIRIADIARRQKIPQKFLELILAGLKQAGFVESRRGAEGGYLLARRPESLTLGEVLRRWRACARARATTAARPIRPLPICGKRWTRRFRAWWTRPPSPICCAIGRINRTATSSTGRSEGAPEAESPFRSALRRLSRPVQR